MFKSWQQKGEVLTPWTPLDPPGSNPGTAAVFAFLGKKLNLFTQVYKWVPVQACVQGDHGLNNIIVIKACTEGIKVGCISVVLIFSF